MSKGDKNIRAGAKISGCGTYRYALWRHWDSDWNGQGDSNSVMFIGLNPSTADATEDDPTLRRCIGFAKSWGFGGLYMLNVFAYRATDPRLMKRQKPKVAIGPRNNMHLAN